MDIFVIATDKTDLVSDDILSQYGYKEYRNENQKKIHQFSYLMIDRILENFYRIQNRELIKDEKPILKSGTKFISLSHSGNYIAIAFSDANCGIDIEQIKQRDYKKISKRMKFRSSSLKEFYMNWTEYEATFKLGGRHNRVFITEIPGYIITAVSTNKGEQLELYYNL